MSGTHGSKHALFTIFIASCAAALAIIFIAIGSAVAKATFRPHEPQPQHVGETGH